MIIQAIINLGWDKPVSEEGGTINWYGEQGLSQSTIDDEVTRLQAEYDSQAYARLRKVEYSKLNQDEMRYDDLTNNTTTWQDSISAIKVAIPKGVA